MTSTTARRVLRLGILGVVFGITACNTPTTADDAGPGLDAGPCGGCLGTGVCDPSMGVCVGCIEDDDCSGSTPHCDRSAAGSPACVRCVVGAHCPSNLPTCSDTRECVECEAPSDCTNREAPRCDSTTNTCELCLDDADCAAFDPNLGRCVAGSCGECSLETQDVDCPGFLCYDGACTAEALGTLGPCRPCTATSDCDTARGLVCVNYRAPAAGDESTGFFCLYEWVNAFDLDECRTPERQPYGPINANTHINAERDDVLHVCGPPLYTTCQGLNDALERRECMGSDDCGLPSVEDGVCARTTSSRPFTCGYRSLTMGDCHPGVSSEAHGSSFRICLP